jgi:KDO2-lipid IV(A) lauroyltransferase
MSTLQSIPVPAPVSPQSFAVRTRSPAAGGKRLGRTIPGLFACIAFALAAVLPPDMASAVGGRVARLLGPALGVSERARRNLRRIFPELTPMQVERIVRGMWDNLGRTAAEYPHLNRIAGRVEVIGGEHVARALARSRPIVFFTAHVGNWELAPAIAARLGAPLHFIYRPLRSRALDTLVQRLRGRASMAEMIPRGRTGARHAVRLLARGEHLGLLLDQKVSRGLASQFLGHDAVTTRSLAHLALRFDCSVLPARVERLDGTRFRLTVDPPIAPVRGTSRAENMRAITARANAIMEGWIRQRPEQWLWLHRRWGD